MSATRLVNGTELPAAGTWQLDPSHAEVGFVGRHFGLTKVRGRFTGVTGTVTIADDPTNSAVEVLIDMATVSSGDTSRDDHLRSGDLFDVERHPQASYRSTRLEIQDAKGTMRRPHHQRDHPSGRTHGRLPRSRHRPFGQRSGVFSAIGRINREDWGVTWNMVLDAGGLLVSKESPRDRGRAHQAVMRCMRRTAPT
jgi:polyisoprenoid-binding protein YceI